MPSATSLCDFAPHLPPCVRALVWLTATQAVRGLYPADLLPSNLGCVMAQNPYQSPQPVPVPKLLGEDKARLHRAGDIGYFLGALSVIVVTAAWAWLREGTWDLEPAAIAVNVVGFAIGVAGIIGAVIGRLLCRKRIALEGSGTDRAASN